MATYLVLNIGNVSQTTFHKLRPKFYGHFKIRDRISQVFCQIELPQPIAANTHNIFHVSQLKSCAQPVATSNPHITTEPEVILYIKMVIRVILYLTLICWKSSLILKDQVVSIFPFETSLVISRVIWPIMKTHNILSSILILYYSCRNLLV